MLCRLQRKWTLWGSFVFFFTFYFWILGSMPCILLGFGSGLRFLDDW